MSFNQHDFDFDTKRGACLSQRRDMAFCAANATAVDQMPDHDTPFTVWRTLVLTTFRENAQLWDALSQAAGILRR